MNFSMANMLGEIERIVSFGIRRPGYDEDLRTEQHLLDRFNELGLSHELVFDDQFRRLFTGDITVAREPMRPVGWATGYALSIYGQVIVPGGSGRKGY